MRNWIRTAVIGAVVATGVDTQPLALEQSGAHFFLSLLSGPATLPWQPASMRSVPNQPLTNYQELI